MRLINAAPAAWTWFTEFWRRRPWVVATIVVVVLGAGSGIGWWAASGSKAAAADPTFRTVAASVGTIKQSVSTSGTVEPADQENVNFAASGRVTSVMVAEGDSVTKGQVLATIDSASLAADLAQAQATLASDQAKVDADEADGITGTQLSADQAALSAAQEQVTSAQSALNGATLRSPITGIVATVSIAVGDQVTGSSGSSGGSGGNGGNGNNGNGSNNGSGSSTAQFLVVGTTSWIVDATVDDTQVGLLKKAQQAQITTDGGTTVYGTISSVGLIASNTSGTATYPVVVKITGSPTGLHAGATATVQLIYKQLANVLTVPTLAVHTQANAGSTPRSYVITTVNGKQTERTVTVGLASGGLTQITSGLAEGDEVLVEIPTGTRSGTTNRNGTGRTGGVFTGGGGGNFPIGGFGGEGGGPVNQVGGK